MTTPMNVYRELAIQYGDIDADDPNAVNRFFESGVYSLDDKTRLTILESLFSRMDDVAALDEIPEILDEQVPLPDPANYQRADAKIRRAKREPSYYLLNSLSEGRVIATIRDENDQGFLHTASHMLAKLTKAVRRLENKFDGDKEEVSVVVHRAQDHD